MMVGCRFTYHSHTSPATKNGSFTSPNFPGLYPRNTVCLYEFVGLSTERVRVTIVYFDVEGIPPQYALSPLLLIVSFCRDLDLMFFDILSPAKQWLHVK